MSSEGRQKLNSDNIVAFLTEIFEQRGGEEYLGEPVTMAEHMLQSAHFAEAAGESDVVVVAALLHDIGHFTSEFGAFSMEDEQDRLHEQAGAEVISAFFPALVVDCVRHHVSAKRYLCAVKPEYLKRLSDASLHSLHLQGGPMSDTEVAEFEQNPNLKEIIKVRYYDEAGKQPNLATKSISDYSQMMQSVVDAHMQQAGG